MEQQEPRKQPSLAEQLRRIAEERLIADKEALKEIKEEALKEAQEGKFEYTWWDVPTRWLYNGLIELGFDIDSRREESKIIIKW